MTLRERLHRLDAVAAHLPFHLEDYDAANRAFQRWAATGEDDALRVVELWAYCFTQRYVLVRFVAHRARHASSEVDRVITAAFQHVRGHLHEVHDPERFTHWVLVICHHTFVNFLRRPRLALAGVEPDLVPDESDDEESIPLDYAIVERALRNALRRLPNRLRPVATLRFLEGRSYEHIAAATGRPVATVRAYVAQAVGRLREDPELRALHAEVLGAALPRRPGPEVGGDGSGL